jgi:hypothetical protein
MRTSRAVRALSVVVAGAAALAVHPGAAEACGGCFVPPQPTGPAQVTETESVITDEKMILSISMTQTTLYDEISYSGSPASFAWVLPIKGTVTVGLSADIMFQTLSQLTAPTITSPPANCPPAPTCGGSGRSGCLGASASVSVAAPLAAAGGYGADNANTVTVTSQMQVGPYETVQLHSNDGSALTAWLTGHGYDIPDYTKPVVAAYVSQGFDFLALKLVPGNGVQTMQPVRVTTQGAAPSLPLHMVAVGTGATTGITIWVVADARWEPQNFPTFIIQDSQLAWDWATSSSNYETLRLANEAKLGGRGWQIESALSLSQYNFGLTLAGNVEYDSNGVGGYTSAEVESDAGAPDASAGMTRADAAGDAAGPLVGVDAGELRGSGLGSAVQAAIGDDLAVLFAGIAGPNFTVTRMRSDVAKSALSVDMALQASSDQSELSNQYTTTQEIGEPECAVFDGNCNQIGTAPRSQAAAASSGSGCSTTRPRSELGTTLATLVAFGGVAAARARRKRRSRHS